MIYFQWTREAIATLKEMRAAKRAYIEIADVLGCTKNAAIGKGHRVGIERTRAAPRPRLKAAGEPKRQAPANAVPKQAKPRANAKPEPVAIAAVRLPVVTLPAPVAKPRPNPTAPIPFIDRRIGDECAWIIGDPHDGEVMCCGAPVVHGQYCAEHYARAHIAGSTQAWAVTKAQREAA